MKSAAVLRSEIEEKLSSRIPSALTPDARRERLVSAVGISEIDELLEGGLPVGALTEIVGPECSGRTTLAIAFVSQQLQAGHVCAWIDVHDTFDPESAAASGVELDYLLWVRCGSPASSSPHRHALSPIQYELVHTAPQHMGGGGSLHPRNEVHGMPEAIEALMHTAHWPQKRNRTIGTPGVSNRSLSIAPTQSTAGREEQVAYDRLPPRRGDAVLQKNPPREDRSLIEPRWAEPQKSRKALAEPVRLQAAQDLSGPSRSCLRKGSGEGKPWSRLDQALRATDLLLQAGGFSAIVLDMGSVPPEAVIRVPLATWFKFRAAADRSRTSLLLLTQHPCAQSSAEVVLRMSAATPAAGRIMTALPYRIELVRQRFKPHTNVVSMRKPPQRATEVKWKAPTAWTAMR